MGDSRGKRGAYDEMYDKIIDVKELMETTRENIEELMEDSQELLADDLEEIDRNENANLKDFRLRFLQFERDCVNLVLDPSKLEQYLKRFQEFMQELNEINQRASDFLLALEDSDEEPEEVNEAAEEQDRLPDLLETKDLQAYSDAADHSMFANPTPTTMSPAVAAARVEGKKKMEVFNLVPTGTNWSVCDNIMNMYGFARTESKIIETQLAEALDENPYQGIGSSRRERILKWRGVEQVKETLKQCKYKYQKLQKSIPAWLKIWILRVENQMYNLLLYLRAIMSGYEAAMARFEELRSDLVEYRRRNLGRIPIVAHRILKLLEMQVPEEQSELNRDQQEAFYRDSGIDQVIGAIHKMILRCKSLLMISGHADHTRRMSPIELEKCEEVLGKTEEELNGIESKIMEGRKDVEKKRKREDEDEDGGNGSGSGSLEM